MVSIKVRRGAIYFAALALAASASGCGDDDGDEASSSPASPSELEAQLAPPEDLGFRAVSSYEWDDPTDFVSQGIYTGAGSTPSDVSGALEDAGFEAGTGQHLEGEEGGFAFYGAASFASAEGAEEALETMHAEDLKQPCEKACVVSPIEYTVEEIPESAAAHHVPSDSDPPKGVTPVEAWHVEFVVGNDLYFLQVSDKPPLSEDDFVSDAEAVYEFASSQD